MRTKCWWEELNTIDNLAGQLDGRKIFKRFVEKEDMKLFDLIQLPTALNIVIRLVLEFLFSVLFNDAVSC